MECPKCQTDNPDTQSFCGDCGTQLLASEEKPLPTQTLETPKKELTTGSTFAGRYQIIEELGRGGMGMVYKAHDTEVKEKVALKLIRPEISADNKTIERFQNELKLARKISHRNVCRMFDLNKEEGSYYITMEYVSGGDLKRFIRRAKRLDTGTAISTAKQICEGLAEAHSHGVVHRDLKPNNIMIDDDGNARIMDFGIARSLSTKGITGAGVMIGTPEYMSPEQVEAKEIDQRTDIYSLGVILYEMVTGQLPFKGDTPLAVAMKHKGETPKDPRDLNPQIPEDLSRVILKCLEKDKERRFPSAEELCSELGQMEKKLVVSQEKEISVEKDLPTVKIEGTPHRKRLQPFFIFGMLILGAIVIGGGYILLKRSSSLGIPKVEEQTTGWKNSIAVLPFRDLSQERNQEHISFGMADAINDRLTQLDVLMVTATTSVMRYKNTEKDIRAIGQELGVKNILEGSVLVEGDRIRVTGQLIDAETGFHLWSDKYDRKLESIIDVQDEVSEAIAEALKVELLPDAFLDLEKDRPENFETYEYYLKGMNYLSSRWIVTTEAEDFETAVEMFEKALEIDPDYSLAYSGLAWGYMLRGMGLSEPRALKEMERYNSKAFELDPDSAMSNSMRAATFHVNGEYEQALSSCRRALGLNSNLAEVNFVTGAVCRQLGMFPKALKYFKKAIELDPYFAVSYGGLARSYSSLAEPEKALPYWEKNFQLMPAYIFPWLAREHMIKGNLNKAEEIIKDSEKSGFNINYIQRTRAYLYAFRGEKEKALELRKEAEIYALLGMKTEAIDIIEKAIVRPLAYNYLHLKNYPIFINLQNEPRFKKILDIQKKKYEERLKWAVDL